MTDWTFSKFDDLSPSSVRADCDPIVFVGPMGKSFRMTSPRAADPSWVSIYFARPYVKSDKERAALRERWPNIEFDTCEAYFYLPVADFALIKFEAC